MKYESLNPHKQRLDYGEQLIAPQGYNLTAAVATTYSLDLNTLLTVPVAMCFGHSLEGPIEQERIALLEALSQLKDSLKVFYQQGNIKIPASYNSLFTLLEPCLSPITPQASGDSSSSAQSAFSSFHPKVWLLRFESETEQPVRYRLIILSRNLTFDRSWDLAAVIDGYLKPKKRRQNQPLASFFESLFEGESNSGAVKEQFLHKETLLTELPYVFWKKPDGFGDIGFLSTLFDAKTGQRRKPVAFKHAQNQSMLVVSPFIKGGSDVKGLDWLATHCPEGKRYLFSRAEELNSVGKDLLSDWHCYAINEKVVNGEEKMELDRSEFTETEQNLHAKLIVNDQDERYSVWHLGSANATAAALGTAVQAPRNSEFMVQLKGEKAQVGVETLVKQWVDVDGFGLFTEHKFAELEPDDTGSNENALRIYMHQILQSEWNLVASPDENNQYRLELISNHLPTSDDFTVNVAPLAAEQYRLLSDQLFWFPLKLSQVSALMRFEISNGSTLKQEFILQLPLAIQGDLDREVEVLNELVHSPKQFYSYLSMLLQIQPDKSLFHDSSSRGVVGELDDQGVISENAVIYEKLMLAAAKQPESLKRIDKLQERLKPDAIPDTFREMWQVFQPFSK